MNSPPMLLLRALTAFLILPGVAAFCLPWAIASRDAQRVSGWPPGILVFTIGLVILLWCVRDFYVTGRGTLAPWDPPKHLVAVGLYRFTRNPMYVGVLTIVIGWTMLTGSPSLIAYTLALAALFHLRIIFGEEPYLSRTHGDEWLRYKARVPRWLI